MHIDIACRLMSDEIAHQQASLFQLNLSALLVVMLASVEEGSWHSRHCFQSLKQCHIRQTIHTTSLDPIR